MRIPTLLLLALLLTRCSDSTGPGQVVGQDLVAIDDASGAADLPDIVALEIREMVEVAPDSVPVDAPDLTDSAGEIAPETVDLQGEEVLEDAFEEEVAEPPAPVPALAVERTDWGGYADLKLTEGSGYFAVTQTSGRLWMVDPAGHAFFSLGIQAVSTGSLDAPALGYAPGKLAQWSKWAAEYQSWGEVSAARLAEHMTAMLAHGFNTVGGWSGGYGNLSGHGIAYSVSLGFAGSVQTALAGQPIPAVSKGNFPDVFHPDFPNACLAYAQKSINANQASDPWNIGYYSDNELRWWGKDYFIISGTWTLADDFIDEAADTPGKEAFVALMTERYGEDIAAFNAVYSTDLTDFAALADVLTLPYDKNNALHTADRDAFVEAIADRYFSSVNAALKTVAPDHLYLCVRFASIAPEPVIRMAAKYCDVVTFNDYYILPDPITEMALGGSPEERWASYGAIVTAAQTPRPIVVTEWGIRADDAGLPNTFGAGFIVDSQAERSDFYRFSADWFLDHTANGLGFVAGWHWFMYLDEPPTGRFDGEDCNYGVVTLRDEKYRFVWEAMAAVNTWVDNRLVIGQEPTLLLPPEQVEAKESVSGSAMVKWSKVPLATSYLVHLLAHPAGTENRVISTHPVDATGVTLNVAGYGLGTYWFAVEAIADGLLSMGPAVSNAIAAEAGQPPTQDEVLACESLKNVRYANDFPLPNDEKGQTYASLVPSFVEDGGMALRLEFLPSSLGYISLSPAGETTMMVDIWLPETVEVAAGDTFHLALLPHPLVLTSQQLTAASTVVWVSILDGKEMPLAQFHLGPLELEPNVPTDVAVPLESNGSAQFLRFEVDLFEPALPLESIITLDVDSLTFATP